jgi:RNA polymerase sigma factor (TIGR02999 family)
MAEGDREAESRLFTLMYEDLRRIAAIFMRQEIGGVTLQPTALVGEAYIRMTGNCNPVWADRAHFLSMAAAVMRHVLVDYARQRLSQKRGAGVRATDLNENLAAVSGNPDEILYIHEAVRRLAKFDSRQAQIVELRYFGGLGIDETADVLGISPRTVKRDWTHARAWLLGELTPRIR